MIGKCETIIIEGSRLKENSLPWTSLFLEIEEPPSSLSHLPFIPPRVSLLISTFLVKRTRVGTFDTDRGKDSTSFILGSFNFLKEY